MAVTAKKSNTVIPLSMCNGGNFGEVLAEVKRSGTKLIVNDDDGAECIIMRPEDYMRMSDDFDNISLLAVANERMSHFDPSKTIPAEELYKEFGITDKDIEGWEDVELE